MRERLPPEKVQAMPRTGASPEALAPGPEGHPLLHLQRTLGNQGVLRRLRLLQRDDDPTADNVKAAVALLQNVNPTSIYQNLSKVQLGGGSVAVSTVTSGSGATATTSVFNLELKVGALTGHAVAQFQGVTPAASGSTRTYTMTITVSPTAATTPAKALAKDLFHEGMHMRLFMDRATAGTSSSYLTKMNEYLTLARNNSNYKQLRSDLAAYIQKHATGKTATTAQAEATQIIEQIVEEKYVLDETVRSGMSPKVQQTASDQARTYQSATTRWLVDYLKGVGADSSGTDEIGSMAGKLRAIWSDIDSAQDKSAQQDAGTPTPPSTP